MTHSEVWQKLLDLVEQSLPKSEEKTQPQLRWLRPNRLVLLDRWQVQARFVPSPGNIRSRQCGKVPPPPPPP